MRVAWSRCSMRYKSSSVCADIWPAAVSMPSESAANVNAAPARGPRTRLTMPSSPIAMPTTCDESDRSSIRRRMARLSAQRSRRRNHLDVVRLKPLNPVRHLHQAPRPREVVKADQQRRPRGSQLRDLRRLGLFGRLHFEIDHLAAGHRRVRQNREFRLQTSPRNFRRYSLRRHVAIAVTSRVRTETVSRRAVREPASAACPVETQKNGNP